MTVQEWNKAPLDSQTPIALILSRLYPNLRSHEARRDMADAYQMHRTILRAFPDAATGGPGRVLFRVDVLRAKSQVTVLVQSDKAPDWSRLPLGWLVPPEALPPDVRPADSKPLSLIFAAGQRFRFRL